MLNLHLLRVFYTVARTGGVSSAAKALFISQPAVSNALKRLQQEYNVHLFQKQGRNLCLTEDGQNLCAALDTLFSAEKHVDSLLQQFGSKTQHSIKLGLVSIYERFGVSDILHRFDNTGLKLLISIHSGNSASVLNMLENHAIDIAITGKVSSDSLLVTPYMRHELFLVIPPGHRLYGKKSFRAADIRGERMVLKEPGSSARHKVQQFMEYFDVNCDVIMELSNIDSILALVLDENCLTFLPDMSLSHKIIMGQPLGVARCEEAWDLSFLTYVASHPLHMYPQYTAEAIQRFTDNVRTVPAQKIAIIEP